jgi:hypothetical protein
MMPSTNPFESPMIPTDLEPEGFGGSAGEFQDIIPNPEEADEIVKANQAPRGFYMSDPVAYPPTISTRVKTLGDEGPRNMGVVNARVTQVVKGETYTAFVTLELSPDKRPKRVYVDGVFSHNHPTKHDAATRMYGEAQEMFKAVLGRYATSVTALLEFLQETPFKVECFPTEDGKLLPYKLAPAGRR